MAVDSTRNGGENSGEMIDWLEKLVEWPWKAEISICNF